MVSLERLLLILMYVCQDKSHLFYLQPVKPSQSNEDSINLYKQHHEVIFYFASSVYLEFKFENGNTNVDLIHQTKLAPGLFP